MKKYCEKCAQMVDVQTEKREEVINVKGTPVVIDATVCRCSDCCDDLWDDAIDKQNLIDAYNEYRKEKNLLTPDDIKGIRSGYGLPQGLFAKILGLGEKTITRYENGSLQDEGPNNLILLAQNRNNLVQLLERADLTQEERASAQASILSGETVEYDMTGVFRASYRENSHISSRGRRSFMNVLPDSFANMPAAKAMV